MKKSFRISLIFNLLDGQNSLLRIQLNILSKLIRIYQTVVLQGLNFFVTQPSFSQATIP